MNNNPPKTSTKEYNSYSSMRARCNNPSHHQQKAYQAKGIGICQGMSNYYDFVKVLGKRPEGTSLDRIDNDASYTCGNCVECKLKGNKKNVRWATRQEQNLNKGMYKVNKSGYTGVYKYYNKWQSSIRREQKLIYVGSFYTPEEANSARLDKLREMGY